MGKNNKKIETSVIIPVYNEEKHIDKCIQSLLKQDYARDKVEYIFVDGNSTDRTVEILNCYLKEHPNIRILHNRERTVPHSMNIGIDNAKGDYIIRLDGHSQYAEDYISKCIEYLEKTGADNVGGVAIPKSDGYIGSAISVALSSRFGVGNSEFRTRGNEGYVDTVPFGAFRKEAFSKYGLYDVRLTRNQDIELNHRIIKNGGKIYLTPLIKLYYFNRDKLSDFIKQNFNNGFWNIITWYLCPGSLSLRHFVPFLFVLSIMALPVLFIITEVDFFIWLFSIELFLYFSINVLFSIKGSVKKDMRLLPLLPLIFLLLHLSYGIGSLVGLLKLLGGGFGKQNSLIKEG